MWTSPAVGWSEVLLGRCDSLTEHEPQILDYPDLVAKQQAAAKTWKTADLSLADLSVLELALDQTMLFWPLQFDWPQLMNSYLWPDESRDWVFYDPEVFLGSSKYAAAQMDIKIETVRRWAEYVYSHTGETCFTIRRLDAKVDRFPLAWYGTGGNDMTKDVEWALQHFTFGFDARVTVRALRQSSFQVPTVTRFTMQYYPLVADRYEFKNRIDTGLPIYSSGIVRSQDLAHLHVTGLAREFGIFGYGNPRECTWEQGRLLTYVPCKAVERLRPRHLLGVRVLPPTAGLSRLLKELYGRLVK